MSLLAALLQLRIRASSAHMEPLLGMISPRMQMWGIPELARSSLRCITFDAGSELCSMGEIEEHYCCPAPTAPDSPGATTGEILLQSGTTGEILLKRD